MLAAVLCQASVCAGAADELPQVAGDTGNRTAFWLRLDGTAPPCPLLLLASRAEDAGHCCPNLIGCPDPARFTNKLQNSYQVPAGAWYLSACLFVVAAVICGDAAGPLLDKQAAAVHGNCTEP